MDMDDPIKLFEAARQLADDAAAIEVKFARLTRKVFSAGAGRDWLRLAVARYNFMGSVHSADDGMSPVGAAYRDGIRSVISDILNSAAEAVPKRKQEQDDNE